MTEHTHWSAGTVIVLQEVWQGKLWSARPVRVAEDGPDLMALWCPEGTPVKGPFAPWRPGRVAGPEFFVSMLTHQDWLFGDFTWRTSNLMLLRTGDWHSVWVSWSSLGEKMGWYVNFQRPFQRIQHGTQTMDLMLDLVVGQDMTWRWKDEDEFETLVSHGLIDGEEAARVRQEAASVIKQIEANKAPFSEPWHDWRPDPSWPLPELPEGWDRLEGVERPE